MASVKARRGNRRGGTDSLIRRLTIAITVSLAGSNVSRTAIASQTFVSATAWRETNANVRATVPSTIVATYSGSARRRQRVQSGNIDGRMPSERPSDLRPGPLSQKAGDSASERGNPPTFGDDCIDVSNVCAMASSLWPLRRARRSIAAQRLVLRVVAVGAERLGPAHLVHQQAYAGDQRAPRNVA